MNCTRAILIPRSRGATVMSCTPILMHCWWQLWQRCWAWSGFPALAGLRPGLTACSLLPNSAWQCFVSFLLSLSFFFKKKNLLHFKKRLPSQPWTADRVHQKWRRVGGAGQGTLPWISHLTPTFLPNRSVGLWSSPGFATAPRPLMCSTSLALWASTCKAMFYSCSGASAHWRLRNPSQILCGNLLVADNISAQCFFLLNFFFPLILWWVILSAG